MLIFSGKKFINVLEDFGGKTEFDSIFCYCRICKVFLWVSVPEPMIDLTLV